MKACGWLHMVEITACTPAGHGRDRVVRSHPLAMQIYWLAGGHRCAQRQPNNALKPLWTLASHPCGAPAAPADWSPIPIGTQQDYWVQVRNATGLHIAAALQAMA